MIKIKVSQNILPEARHIKQYFPIDKLNIKMVKIIMNNKK